MQGEVQRLVAELPALGECGQDPTSASVTFPNMFCWLAMRADDPSWFAGVIPYFKTVVAFFFEGYTQLYERLKIQAHTYYCEHVHIDVFHAMEGQRLLKAMDVRRVN